MSQTEGGNDNKTEVKKEEATITILVRDQHGGEIQFKVKRHTKFQKIMDAYSTKKGVAGDTIRYLWEGRKIGSQQTPAELDIQDGDVVEAVMEMLGGHLTVKSL